MGEQSGKSGTKEISSRYPCVDGLTAGTTTQEGHTMNLVAEETYVLERDKKLI